MPKPNQTISPNLLKLRAADTRAHIVASPQGDPVVTFTHPGLDAFPLLVFTMDQETPLERHTHDFIELVYVKNGTSQHEHEGRKYSIIAGDSFVIPPGEQHTYIEGSNFRIVNMLFHPAMFGDHYPQLVKVPGFVHFFSTEPQFRGETLFRHKLHLSVAQQKTAVNLCNRLEEEISSRQGGYEAMAAGLFLQLVVYLSRCFDRSIRNKDERDELEGQSRTISSAIAYLEQNYANDVHLSDVAHSAYMSPTRLSHVFKEATGMSLIDYLTKLRIDQASHLLTDTDRSITDIAFGVGFHDPAYFTRIFAKATGASPSALRKKTIQSK